MIRIILIEDELPARKKLRRFLAELDEPVSVIAEAGSVQEAVDLLGSGLTADLIFSDIELLDGTAFEVFEQVKITCPVIFTTAYDRYWMNAFETNGIEYLLKPFSMERFRKAWEKFLLFRGKDTALLQGIEQLIRDSTGRKNTKKRFSVHTQAGMYFVETEDILYFLAEEGVVFALDHKGNRHLLSCSTLKEVEEATDPAEFFRINRAEVVHRKYIERIERYSKNALSVKLKGHPGYLVTSQANTAGFRAWLEE